MSHDSDKPLVTADVLERLPSEAVEIIQVLLARIEELERRLGMNSQNSSLPPSSEHPHAKQPKPKRPNQNCHVNRIGGARNGRSA